ncbi:hypothetical protein DMB66_00040 [Actinoplanes sp. ATCC 53533]|uniref:hypothetical protein n=1 Tax=Actinoplanes sp. ATCC 53533 TaxID=1288362 RepID=UPI000F76E536|nr:hypothetical protein [Actinoplanes sp. ATCC 53533]RSM75195.1 hypothetical protein DMB66_00040 [Actinoplanes sp. ATCC 53533]
MTTSPRTSTPPTDHPYEHTLLDLRARQQTLSEALERAATRKRQAGRRAALSDLHTQIRGMAAVANHALGGWPEPDQEPQ